MKHTPGPWELSEAVYIEGPGTYRRIQQTESFGDVVGTVCVKHTLNHTLNECAEANAAVLVAAPELLDALIAITNQLERVGDTRTHKDGQFIDDARAVIAKATGATP